MELEELFALMAAQIYTSKCIRHLPQDAAARERLMQDAMNETRKLWRIARLAAREEEA